MLRPLIASAILVSCAADSDRSPDDILIRCWDAARSPTNDFAMEIEGMAMIRNEGRVFSKSARCPSYALTVVYKNADVARAFRQAEQASEVPIYFGFKAKGTFGFPVKEGKFGLRAEMKQIAHIRAMTPRERDVFMRRYHL